MMVRILAGLTVLVIVTGAAAGTLVLGRDGGTRPAVVFDHGLHVDALGDGRCSACHQQAEDGSPVLVRSFPRDRDQAHDRCAGCHADQEAGPTLALCGACHVAGSELPPPPASTAMTAFDHDQHNEILDEACERCHHVMDLTSGRLVPADGDEAACLDCHQDEGLRRAAHQLCVSCHLTGGGQASAGPVRCRSCHAGPVGNP